MTTVRAGARAGRRRWLSPLSGYARALRDRVLAACDRETLRRLTAGGWLADDYVRLKVRPGNPAKSEPGRIRSES